MSQFSHLKSEPKYDDSYGPVTAIVPTSVHASQLKSIQSAFHAFGAVSAATWQGGRVAVKVMHAALTRAGERRVQREAQVLVQCRHPNVVNFYGLMLGPYRLVMVLGLMNLRTFTQDPMLHPSLDEVTLKILLDVAVGMAYLHAQAIVHRDLKPENCIVTALPT